MDNINKASTMWDVEEDDSSNSLDLITFFKKKIWN
jgi:hypothetical protein